ncbi:MAG: transposase [Myxococcota bacterium]|nr:transposase [Myxococcota bacterium]
MSRPPRALTVVPGVPHHLIWRGNNRRRLFSYWTCYARFLRELERAAHQYELAIHALVLMTNHVHLVATPLSVEMLSACMHRVGQQYAVFRNQRRGASGKLFQERYRCKPVLDETYLARLVPYVELNPERAGMVDDLAHYRWSTFALHTGRAEQSIVPPSLWTPSPWWMSLGANASERAERHLELIAACRRGGAAALDAADVQEIAEHELASAPYARRLLRPDGSRAAEETARFLRRS